MDDIPTIGEPHLFGDEPALFERVLGDGVRNYLEFGLGGSTLAAARAGAEALVAVDSDGGWVPRRSAASANGAVDRKRPRHDPACRYRSGWRVGQPRRQKPCDPISSLHRRTLAGMGTAGGFAGPVKVLT